MMLAQMAITDCHFQPKRLPGGSEVKDLTITCISYIRNQIKKLVLERKRLGGWEEWHLKINFSIENV